MIKEKVVNHPDWQANKAASMMFEDKIIRSGDYGIFCRSPMAEYSSYTTVNMEQFVTDIDGKVYCPAVRMLTPMGPAVHDAIAWAPWEEYSKMRDTMNDLQKSARVMDPEFIKILKGERSFRTKAEQKKELQGAFDKILAVLGK